MHRTPSDTGPQTEEGLSGQVELEHAEGGHELNSRDFDSSTGFFMKKLFGHEREGFVGNRSAGSAELRLQEDREQGVQRAAAHAPVRISMRPSASKSSRSCWACWPSRRHSKMSLAPARAVRRSSKAEGDLEQVQLQGLSRLPDGSLGSGLRPGRFRRSAKIQRLLLPRPPLHAAGNCRFAQNRQSRTEAHRAKSACKPIATKPASPNGSTARGRRWTPTTPRLRLTPGSCSTRPRPGQRHGAAIGLAESAGAAAPRREAVSDGRAIGGRSGRVWRISAQADLHQGAG